MGTLGQERGEDRPNALDALIAERASEPAALLLRGAYDVRWAWSARGVGGGSTVTRAQFEVFFERLRRAERDLLRAAQLDPADPAAWGQLLISGRGLEIGKAELLARFAEVQRRAPGLWGPHTQMLQGLCAKWHGSHEEMFEFARRASAGAGPGSPLHALVAIAHYERYLAIGDDAERAEYARGEPVRTELESVAHQALASEVLRQSPAGRMARDVLAYVAGLLGVDRLAAQLYEATGDVITPGIWWGNQGWPGWYARTRANVTSRLGA